MLINIVKKYKRKLSAKQLKKQNVKKFRDKLVIINMEAACIGPKLWDKTTLVYSLLEYGYVELGMKLFEQFQCNKQMLECIAAVRLDTAISKKDVSFTQRKMAFDFIKNI